MKGKESYRVERTWVVDPDDVSVLDPTPARALTLVTCYPSITSALPPGGSSSVRCSRATKWRPRRTNLDTSHALLRLGGLSVSGFSLVS